jgi:hypothetical protein
LGRPVVHLPGRRHRDRCDPLLRCIEIRHRPDAPWPARAHGGGGPAAVRLGGDQREAGLSRRVCLRGSRGRPGCRPRRSSDADPDLDGFRGSDHHFRRRRARRDRQRARQLPGRPCARPVRGLLRRLRFTRLCHGGGLWIAVLVIRPGGLAVSPGR